MKILSIQILKICELDDEEKPIIISSASDFSEYSYFQRSGVNEFCTFFSRTLCVRVKVGTRQQFDKKGYKCYVHPRSCGICGVIISDDEYPNRVGFSLIYKILLEFEKTIPIEKWKKVKGDNEISFPPLKKYLTQYQDPEDGDDLMKIQKDLDDVETLMNKAMEDVMEREEELNELMKDSSDLSYMSKKFYNDSADKNSCCSVQ